MQCCLFQYERVVNLHFSSESSHEFADAELMRRGQELMHVAVISDLHLGASARTDLFGHEDDEFLTFLNFLEANFEQIILLGDIWETLTARSYKGQLRELYLAQERHREIAARFMREKYRFVHGNHDLVAAQANGASEEYCLEVDGTRMLFSHGHQGDDICHSTRTISELGVWAGGWLRKMGMHLLYTYFADLEGRRSLKESRCVVRNWAVGQANQRRADVVVTGHTHIPAKAEDGNCLFLNSGTCAHGNISFLSLDTKRGDYQHHSSF